MAWLAVFLLALGLLFQNTPGVFTEHGIVFNDTDPYYRLHRIERIVSGPLIYPLHDGDLSYPDGFDVPWPTGLDYAIAIPLRLFGVRKRPDIKAWAAFAVPVIGLLTLLFTARAAYAVGGPFVSIVAALLTALHPSFRSAGELGRLDHHALEACFTALALWLYARSRDPTAKRPLLPIALLLGLAPSFWPQAWILAFFVGAAWLLDASRPRRPGLSDLFLLAGVISLAPLSLSGRFWTGAVSLFGFSWWTPLIYVGLGLLAGVIAFLETKPRRLSLRHFVPLVFASGIGIFLLSRHAAPAVGSALRAGLAALVPVGGTMSLTAEAVSPLLHTDLWRACGLFLSVAATLWALSRFRPRAPDRWLAGFALGPLALALLQARFGALAAPVATIAVAFFLSGWFEAHMDRWRIRRALALGAGLLLLAPGIRFGWTHEENAHPFFRAVQDCARFLRFERDRRGLSPSDSAVAAPWEYGHWILEESGLPVIAHPFQGPGALETLDLYVSTDAESLRSYEKRFNPRFLLVEAPTGRLQRWIKMLGKDDARFFAPDGKGLEAREAFYDLWAVRFFTGKPPKDWKLIYVSPYASPDRRDLPALKLFERVPR